jgi:hypothetical protein
MPSVLRSRYCWCTELASGVVDDRCKYYWNSEFSAFGNHADHALTGDVEAFWSVEYTARRAVRLDGVDDYEGRFGAKFEMVFAVAL